MKRGLEILLLCLLALVCLTRARVAHAATILVDSTAYETLPTINGNCTLLEALYAARYDSAMDGCAAGSGSDVLALPAGTFLLGVYNPDYPYEPYALLIDSGTLTIMGAGADLTILQPNPELSNTIGIFRVTGSAQLTLDGLTLRDGSTTIYGAAIRNEATLTVRNTRLVHNTSSTGGAIENTGTATIFDSVFFDNSATMGSGGAIRNAGPSLTISNTAIYSNTAGSWGGGLTNDNPGGHVSLHNAAIYGNRAYLAAGVSNTGGMEIDGSQIHDNEATAQPNGAAGGIANSGTLTITNSTISGNKAAFFGGIYNAGDTANLSVTASTLSGNIASDGGAFGNGHGGVAKLLNVTVNGNTATAGVGGIVNDGTLELANVTIADNHSPFPSGVSHIGGTTRVRNSIVANDSAVANCSGAITSDGSNLDSGNSCSFSDAGDLIHTDPQLGPLGDNGGPTYTQALLPGSPALDAGDPSTCPATDQRGTARPQDGNGDGTASCDIGAYEADPVSTVTPTPPETAAPTSTPPSPAPVWLCCAANVFPLVLSNNTFGDENHDGTVDIHYADTQPAYVYRIWEKKPTVLATFGYLAWNGTNTVSQLISYMNDVTASGNWSAGDNAPYATGDLSNSAVYSTLKGYTMSQTPVTIPIYDYANTVSGTISTYHIVGFMRMVIVGGSYSGATAGNRYLDVKFLRWSEAPAVLAGTVKINQLTGTYNADMGTVPVDIVHVMDISGSMSDNFGGMTKLNAAKNALKNFNTALPGDSGNQVGLVTFPEVTSGTRYNYACQQSGSYTSYFHARLRSGLTTDTAAVNTIVNSMTTNGGTSLAAGLQAGRLAVLDADKHDASYPAIMIVASDGLANIRLDGKWTGFQGNTYESPPCNAAAVQDVLEQAQLAKSDANRDGKPDVIIYSIAIGDDFNPDVMQAIASEPVSSHYFRATGASSLQNIYAQIAGDVQTNRCEVSQQEAPAVGAVVTIRNTANNATLETTTDADGNFSFQLDPAIWEFASASITVNGVTYDTFTDGIGGPVLAANPTVVVTSGGYIQNLSLKTNNFVCPDPPTRTPTPTPTETLTPTATETPTLTSTPSDTPSATPTYTATASDTPSLTPTFTVTASNTPSATPTYTATASDTPSATPTQTPSYTPSHTPSLTPTHTNTPTDLPTATFTVTPTLTRTFTLTPSRTNTPTPSRTLTPTASRTFTPTPSRTFTPTASRTNTPTPSRTLTWTPTRTRTFTPTTVRTNTPKPTPTRTRTNTPTITRTNTPKPTATFTATRTRTRTATLTANGCDTAPAAPPLIAPANNAALAKTQVALKWGSVACAGTYLVQVRQDAKQSANWWSTSATGLSAQVKNLLQGHRYYWRVQACTDATCGAWSKWRSFQIKP